MTHTPVNVMIISMFILYNSIDFDLLYMFSNNNLNVNNSPFICWKSVCDDACGSEGADRTRGDHSHMG